MAAYKARQRRGGQALVEYILVYGVLVLPVMFMVTFTAQMMWIWNTGVEWTRIGARYAATHCAQAGGGNVQNYMRQNVPTSIDQDQFQSGGVTIQVNYFQRNPETGDLQEYECASECSLECTPEAVTIRVQNYQFRGIQSYLGLAPLSMPDWVTSVPIESGGCDPETGECLP